MRAWEGVKTNCDNYYVWCGSHLCVTAPLSTVYRAFSAVKKGPLFWKEVTTIVTSDNFVCKYLPGTFHSLIHLYLHLRADKKESIHF